jgi:hypothetical protein
MCLLALVAGCDQGEPEPEPFQGPRLGLVATYPLDGAGLECPLDAPPECGVPIDTPIELRFDRVLLASTATRQSILLYTGNPNNQPGAGSGDVLQPTYDLVERVVRYRLPDGKGLAPRTLYTVELPVPVEDDDFGFRAFDGAPLAATRQPLRFSFWTSAVEDTAPPDEPIPDCSDVLTLFSANPGQGACTNCHNPERAPQGLDLSSGNALLSTAIGRVAHQTDLGTTTGEVLESPARMGIDMPIIDPGRPDNSYLMYKLIVRPDNYRRSAEDPDLCGSAYRVAEDETCLPPSEPERVRLREWFVRGEPMPLTGPEVALDRSQMQAIQRFIRAGASCE